MKRFNIFLKEVEILPQGKISDRLVGTFGRHQPAHRGHRQVLDKIKDVAKNSGADFEINTSRSFDPKKNPIPFAEKIDHLRRQNPEFATNITDNEKVRTMIDYMTNANERGYRNLDMVVGQDRVPAVQNLARRYNGPGEGKLFNFNEINVHSAGDRAAEQNNIVTPQKKTVTTPEMELKKFIQELSASRMRKWAQTGDFENFFKGARTHSKYGEADVRELFNILRSNMKVQEEWEIDPFNNLNEIRILYKEGQLYNLGDIVESRNTGLVGKITRCGSNHVICVTENGMMFKSFIHEIYK